MARGLTLKESFPGLRRIGRYFWPYIRQQRSLVIGSMLALFASVGLGLLEPWPLKFVFDRLFRVASKRRFGSIPALDSLDPMTVLALAAVAIVVITGSRALVDYWKSVGFAQLGNRVLTQIRNQLYRHLQRLSLSFHSGARAGDLTVRVIADVNMLRDVVVTAALPMAASLLILVGMWAIMFWMQWRLALLGLATLPFLWISTLRKSRRIHEAARKQRQRQGAMAATAAESMSAIKTVQALSLEEIFAQEFDTQSRQSQKDDVKAGRLSAGLERTVDVLLAIATALVLFYGARLVMNDLLTPGALLVFLAYLKRAFNPLQDFAKYSGRLAKAAAAGERVVDVLERVPEVRDLPGAVPAPALRGAVWFDKLGFAYEPGRPVLENVDFEVPAGQHVALVGPSGIGKSTLVSLVMRLYDPTEGRVMIDGRDIREFTLDSLRAQVSVVLQESILFASSVRDNISYARPDATLEEVQTAARLANAHEFIEALPQGYDTVIGERGVTLSAGQRQRVAIARAAVRRAPILILDEPTSGLDEENARAVTEALERLAAGRTTFLITHDLQHAARTDMIMYLEGGRVLERGAHDELMRANGRYAGLYRMQAATGAVLVDL